MIRGITPENLMRTLPLVLQQDNNINALALAIAQELSALAGEAALASIYANIDTLPEEVLDTLARDFKVDWWSFDYTAEEKRRTLKNSWYVHRHLGTKSAVERALSAVYEGSQVTEWFEYGGKPYHFKLEIPVDLAELDTAKHSVVLGLVAFYKNLRSVLDAVEYHGSTDSCNAYVLATDLGCDIADSSSVFYDNSGHVSAVANVYTGAAGLGYEISDSSVVEYDNGAHVSTVTSVFTLVADTGCELVDESTIT